MTWPPCRRSGARRIDVWDSRSERPVTRVRPGGRHPVTREGGGSGMSVRRRIHAGATALAVALLLAVSVVAAAWAQEATPIPYTPPENVGDLSGQILADGSSTVGPITEAVAEEFFAIAPGVEVEVNISGTGGGFKRFCAGETDIQDASRPISEEEIEMCREAGVQYYTFEVAYDGLSIVVNPENDFVECLTVDQLRQLWEA